MYMHHNGPLDSAPKFIKKFTDNRGSLDLPEFFIQNIFTTKVAQTTELTKLTITTVNLTYNQLLVPCFFLTLHLNHYHYSQ